MFHVKHFALTGGRRPRRLEAAPTAGRTRPHDLRLHHRRRRLGRVGAGQPPLRQERQPGAAARSRPGYPARQGAARGARQLPRHRLLRPALPLDRAQGAHRGRVPQQPAGEPAAAAQIRAGAHPRRRLLHQRPARQPRRAGRLRGVGGARRARLGLGGRAALLQEDRARHGLRGPPARQGGAHPRAAHLPRAMDRPCQGRRRGLQGGGLRVPAGPERGMARRLLSDRHLQCLRAARVGGHRLSRPDDAPAAQPDDLDRHASGRAAVRGQALRRRGGAGRRRAPGVPGARGDPLVRRHPLAGAPVARRHRPGRASEGAGDRGAREPRRRRPGPDGPPVDLGRRPTSSRTRA